MGQVEEWRDVVGFEGLYQVSSLGKVKSLSRSIYNGKGFYLSKDKILKPNVLAKGYLQVDLKRKRKRHALQVHRIVAMTFIPNPNGYPQINHINGDKQDNRVDNLEWCNNSQNQIHAWRTGLQRKHNTWGGKRKGVRVALIGIDGEVEKIYDFATHAAKEFGDISSSNLLKAINRNGKFHNRKFILV